MTPERRAEIRKRCEAATPGPWDNPGMAVIPLTFDHESNIYPPDTTKTHGFQFGGPVAVVKWRSESELNTDGADAEFIAHARTDLPLALDALEAAEREIARLKARPDHGNEQWCGIQNGVVECEKPYIRARIATLERALAESEVKGAEDTARLDWLWDNGWIDISDDDRKLMPRAAIDAFRKERDAKGVEAVRCMDFLREHTVNVRIPLYHGSRDLFWYSPPVDEEGDPDGGQTLEQMIDAARKEPK